MTEVDNILIEYENQITDIDIEYINDVTDIVITLGADIQSVFSVNSLTGHVVLTAEGSLTSVSASAGIYSYTFTHGLNYSYPIVTIYNTSNQTVIADVEITDSNSVTIKSVVDLSGYRVVAQR